jgi:hypothetical protein
MAYTVTGIAELVEYHLVASAPDDDAAHSNLVQLAQKLERLAPRPLRREATWVFCDRCGPRSIPTSSTPTVITTPTMETSAALTVGKRDDERKVRSLFSIRWGCPGLTDRLLESIMPPRRRGCGGLLPIGLGSSTTGSCGASWCCTSLLCS